MLASLWAEQRPTRWDETWAYDEGRKPLASAKKEIAIFLQSLHEVESAHPDPWASARQRLRADPHAALPELDALLSAGS